VNKASKAARRITLEHNRWFSKGCGGNGKLVFGPDGSGGAWYSSNAYGFGGNLVVVSMRRHRMTYVESQGIIDNQVGAMAGGCE